MCGSVYTEKTAFAYLLCEVSVPRNSREKNVRISVARGPVPRNAPPFHRSAGACPPRSPACPGDCSSGSPEPERVKIGRTPPTETKQITCPPRASCCLKQDSQDSHDLQDYLPRNEQSFSNGCLFRSFRTCMSIETHVDPFSRSARTLIALSPAT